MSFTVSRTQTTFTRTHLWPERTYTYFVYAIDAAGNRSANSNSVSFTTPADTTAPSPAPVLSTTAVSPTRVSLAWTASTDDVSQVWYTLLVDEDPYFGDVINLRSATVLDLSPSTTYAFPVTARDTFGNTVRSNTVAVTTPAVSDVTAPTAPTNLDGSDAGACENWMRWDASSDDTDPASSILYEVYVNGELAPESSTIGSTSTVAYGRVPGVNTFVVTATDTSGNVSEPSETLTMNLSC